MFHQPKILKSQKIPANDYIIFAGPDLDVEKLSKQPYITTISIDIGVKNFAFRMERRWRHPESHMYVVKLETLSFDLASFPKRFDEKKRSILFKSITEFIMNPCRSQYYPDVHLLVVERQIEFAPTNIKIQQHIMSFMSAAYPHITIVDLNNKVKSAALGGPKGREELKAWSVMMAYHYMRYHDRLESVALLDGMSDKNDDISDTIVQLEAFCNLVKLPCTNLYYNISGSAPVMIDFIEPTPARSHKRNNDDLRQFMAAAATSTSMEDDSITIEF